MLAIHRTRTPALWQFAPPAADFIQAERPEWRKSGLERFTWTVAGALANPFMTRLALFEPVIEGVDRLAGEFRKLDDQALRQAAIALRPALRRDGFRGDLVYRAFAIVREVADRTLHMRHFESQLLGGRVILSGMVAEMQTGEGKTLTATLPAATAALAGYPVHVISVNDYLTARDAEEMGPVYEFLGLSVGCVIHDVDPDARKAHYGCDITYCSNKDLTFDYLRDRITLGTSPSNVLLQSESLYTDTARSSRLLQRGLHFAILDEVDSVLIDDARTPLIISSSRGAEGRLEFMQQAYEIASALERERDFQLDFHRRTLYLTNQGRDEIARRAEQLGPEWVGKIRREEAVHKALTARYLFIRDEQYIVVDGKVQIVDENTGRVMPDRSWERGLHQLIELKEGCELSEMRETQAKISYQRFFSRYLFLAGMTGTATEVKQELWDVYGLRVVRIPPYRPCQRIRLRTVIESTEARKWHTVVGAMKRIHETGAPVLVGTRSVMSSEKLCTILDREGMDYRLLNARQDKEEADIVAQAGRAGQITIATNMAGRGTDIKLTDAVCELGGLHVILTERFEAGRIDRQLEGRCARQGDPGVYLEVLSATDLKEVSATLMFLSRLTVWWHHHGLPFGEWLNKKILRYGQRSIEVMNFRTRRRMLKADERQGEMLSFSGRFE